MRVLHRGVPGRRPVPSALDELKPGHGREALQVVHGEDQRTVDQAVDHEAMFAGVDVRYVGASRRVREMERGGRDHAELVLKGRRDMKHEPERIG